MALTGNFGRIPGGESLSGAVPPGTTSTPVSTYAPRTDFSNTVGGTEEALGKASTIIPGIPDVYIFGLFQNEAFAGKEMSQEARTQQLRQVLSAEPLDSGLGYKLGPDTALAKQWREKIKAAWGALPPGKKQAYEEGARLGIQWDPFTDPERFANDKEKLGAAEDEEEQKTAYENWQETDVARVEELAALAAQGDQRALDQLRIELGGIKDPAIAEYLGNIESQAAQVYADPEFIAAQQRDLEKYERLSDPTITAEEKLMMELSRKENEGILRGQREALADNLQQRGLYGSGSELTQNAINQQGAASRHAMEQLRAQANAQSRAMEMLGKHTELAGTLRETDTKEKGYRAEAADLTTKWNKEFRQKYDDAKLKHDMEVAGNKRKQTWEIYGEKLKAPRRAVDDAVTIAGLKDPSKPGGAIARSTVFGEQRDELTDKDAAATLGATGKKELAG